MSEVIPIDLVRHDPDLQMRSAGLDVGVVTDYAEAMSDGAEFPPIIVFFDGNGYWPGDGFHRLEAARRAERDTILADVRDGGKREAVLYAVGANASHGLRRTAEDKRRAVLAMLRDPEWSQMSDRKIAEATKVSHPTVAKVRAELTGKISTGAATPPTGKISTPTTGASGGGSMVERMLSTASTDLLVAECRRRGLEVSGHAD